MFEGYFRTISRISALRISKKLNIYMLFKTCISCSWHNQKLQYTLFYIIYKV